MVVNGLESLVEFKIISEVKDFLASWKGSDWLM